MARSSRRILLLGASGGCGRWLGRLATARGHTVTALVRSETPYEPPASVRVVRGHPLDAGCVASLLPGHDAVVSCVGVKRRHPWNPWSALASPPDLATRVARVLVPPMESSGVRRLVAISAAGVGESAFACNPMIRFFIRNSRVGDSYRDLEGMEAVLRGSRLDWLAVRPVTLVDAPRSGRAREIRRYRTWSVISRSDVAVWLLDAVERAGDFENRTPMLGWW